MATRTSRGVALASVVGLILALPAHGVTYASAGGGTRPECAGFVKHPDIRGKTVSVYTPIRGIEAELLQQSWQNFVECTGVRIEYEGSADFETGIVDRVAEGRAPDIAFFPQPGLVETFARDAKLRPLAIPARGNAKRNFSESWLNYGTFDGTLYATPLDANVKSFVWYSPKMFRDAGWRVPRTWDELIELSDTIAASGVKPWCAGIESGVATGWPVTDWVEDVLLRMQGPEVYDRWIAHEIPFDDPMIVQAVDRVGSVLRNEPYVNGGFGDVRSIATTSYQDGGWPVLDGECALHRQGSFCANFWPTGTTVGEDGDVSAFYLPADGTEADRPVLGAGHFVAAFAKRPEVDAVRAYLTTGHFANSRAKLGNWVSANRQLDVTNVVNPIDQQSVALLQDPGAVFRFDASDLMPSEVGAGTFWSGMTAWINGQDTGTTLADIEASWPTN